MSIRRRLVSMFALVTLGLVIALGIRPASLDRIFSAYAVALAALGLLALTRAAHAAAVRSPSIFEYSLTPRPEGRVRPPELIRIEREITLGAASAAHLHRRLLPLLREAAATRLSARHHVDLVRRPEAARELLGDDAWDVLRPDRPEPLDRNAPGLSLRRIARLVQTLEQL
jgi:hypothetical protein